MKTNRNYYYSVVKPNICFARTILRTYLTKYVLLAVTVAGRHCVRFFYDRRDTHAAARKEKPDDIYT